MKQLFITMLIVCIVSTAFIGTPSSSPIINNHHSDSLQLPAGVKRTELQRHDLSVKGREVVQVRVELEPGVEFGNHTHPGEEIVNVLEGKFEYRVNGKSITLKAGDVLFIPSGAVHSAKNIGRTNAAELATYIVEKGKPILTRVK